MKIDSLYTQPKNLKELEMFTVSNVPDQITKKRHETSSLDFRHIFYFLYGKQLYKDVHHTPSLSALMFSICLLDPIFVKIDSDLLYKFSLY